MIAAAMQIATGARSDVTIYQQARRYLVMSMLDSYPLLVMGHGDDGRGDGIWRGITTAYLMKERPALYRESMDRLTWWHDLSREPGGSIGIATLAWDAGQIKHLKKGTNVLAAYGNVEFDNKTQAPCGQMDLAIEGLKMSDLK
jgi:hypothetical protein